MILSIGEILSDMVGKTDDGITTFSAFCGGAPFNLAVNAKQAGAKVGFLGRVGDDPIGRFVTSEAKKAKLDYLELQIDHNRNTTIAFVTLTDGERDFAFYRHDTADYNIDINSLDFQAFKDLTIVHLGSLMLSEASGRKLASEIARKVKQNGLKLSFDINFRVDTFENFDIAKMAYEPFVENADILKFSQDELYLYTNIADIEKAAMSLCKKNQLLLVTLGKHGSAYYYNGMHDIIPTVEVKHCVDTTGAGDAFFGAFLAEIENKALLKENIENALVKANEKGARATEFMGAIKL